MSQPSQKLSLSDRIRALSPLAILGSLLHTAVWAILNPTTIAAAFVAVGTFFAGRMNPVLTYPAVAALLAFVAVVLLGSVMRMNVAVSNLKLAQSEIQSTPVATPSFMTRFYSQQDKDRLSDALHQVSEVINTKLGNVTVLAGQISAEWTNSVIPHLRNLRVTPEPPFASLREKIASLQAAYSEISSEIGHGQGPVKRHHSYQKEIDYVIRAPHDLLIKIHWTAGECLRDIEALEVLLPMHNEQLLSTVRPLFHGFSSASQLQNEIVRYVRGCNERIAELRSMIDKVN